MRIGIDARMYGPKVGGGGLGRYVEQLVTELKKIDDHNRYVLFLKRENASDAQTGNPNMETRVADIHWYTVQEQLRLGAKIDREKLDLVHFPHWNVPRFLKTPFVVTVHDLILLEEPRSAKATTKHPFVYALKYAGFKEVLRHALFASKKIITVSEYTKTAIKKYFPDIPTEKIAVIYEGVTQLGPSSPAASDATNAHPYLLYVGNAYPHKNLESLLHAFSFFHTLHPQVRLVLAGRDDVFYERLRNECEEISLPPESVQFVMNPTDGELHDLYHGAAVYVFPSRVEGFGLPALEAMQAGIPVAASRAGSLPEILADAAVYFHPDDIEEMVETLEQALTNADLRRRLIEKGTQRVQTFSWHTMAEQTLAVYEEVHQRKNR